MTEINRQCLNLIAALVPILEPILDEQPGIAAAYLLGSAVKDQLRDDSDIAVAGGKELIRGGKSGVPLAGDSILTLAVAGFRKRTHPGLPGHR